LAEQRKAVEDLRAGYGELVQRAKGDQDRLAALSAGYEANLKEKQEALAKLQDELRDTKAQLAKADPKKSFIVVSEAFRQLAEAAGESSITLADKNATTNRQRGVVTITMTPERLEKMRHILETQSDPTLSFGWCKKGDRGCLKSRQKCENSGECVGMRVVEYVQAESANLE